MRNLIVTVTTMEEHGGNLIVTVTMMEEHGGESDRDSHDDGRAW